MSKRDEVREQIARVFYNFDTLPEFEPGKYYKQIDQILAIDGIAVVDRQAELPENPHEKEYEVARSQRLLSIAIYAFAQQDMLKKGWVKEVK